ncbi:hypothetical protein [Ramlibacter sp.]|uniref:hypothetical protein n=1 Tax=Ramlibacter sp. TaxID=1917967 RepID=UPI003D13C0E5
MTEPGPVSFSLLALAVAFLGPVIGPYALLVFAACFGAALALSAQDAGTRMAGIRFVVGGVVLALLLTGPLVYLVHRFTDVPGNIAFVPVAFILGVGRNLVVDFIRKAFDALAAALGAFLNAAAARRGGGK